MSDHECLFPEEQEPSGRLILAPCLTCELSALDALDQMKSDLKLAHETQDQFAREVVAAFAVLGIREPDTDDNLADTIAAVLSSYPLGEGQTQQGDER